MLFWMQSDATLQCAFRWWFLESSIKLIASSSRTAIMILLPLELQLSCTAGQLRVLDESCRLVYQLCTVQFSTVQYTWCESLRIEGGCLGVGPCTMMDKKNPCGQEVVLPPPQTTRLHFLANVAARVSDARPAGMWMEAIALENPRRCAA